MNYFNLVKSVIKSKNFQREDMIAKIDRFHLLGNLSDDEAEELHSSVDEYINADAERPELLKLIQTLGAKIEALTERVSKLEQNGNTESDGTETDNTEYEKWTKWDGINDKYQLGAIVEHNGVVYESVYYGQNVWEPGISGTEALWKVYEGETTI